MGEVDLGASRLIRICFVGIVGAEFALLRCGEIHRTPGPLRWILRLHQGHALDVIGRIVVACRRGAAESIKEYKGKNRP